MNSIFHRQRLLSSGVACLTLVTSACGMPGTLSKPVSFADFLPEPPSLLQPKRHVAVSEVPDQIPARIANAPAQQPSVVRRHAVALPYFSFSQRASRASENE